MSDAAAQSGQSQDSGPGAFSDLSAAVDRTANDLIAASYLPLCDVLADDADLVLNSLTRARIAAYLLPPQDGVARVYVDAQERSDARSIVNATGARTPPTDRPEFTPDADTNAVFAELTAGWHVDTVAAIRAAEQQLADDEADQPTRPLDPGELSSTAPDEVEHYVAPPPPPLPRISAATLRALLVIVVGIAVLIFGGVLHFDPNLTLLLGVAGILLGAGMLVMRLRPHGDDDYDDGAVL